MGCASPDRSGACRRSTMTRGIVRRIEARRERLRQDRLEACRTALAEVLPEVEAAAAGDVGAWSKLFEAARARPDAFPEGFAALLLDACADALGDAGAR